LTEVFTVDGQWPIYITQDDPNREEEQEIWIGPEQVDEFVEMLLEARAHVQKRGVE